MKTITVLLVDDHDIVRQGLRVLLETAPDIRVIGEATNGHQAVRETKRLQPGVVLLDLAMPLLNGIEAARQIAHEVPRARVLILSSYRDENHLRQAVEAGVTGYLIKETCGRDLLEAVRATSNGEASFSPPLFKHLLKERHHLPLDQPALSSRQTEILQLIAEGHGTKQIADVLSICAKTVQKHRQSLMDKLGMHKIASLTSYAVSSGVIELNVPLGWSSGCPAA